MLVPPTNEECPLKTSRVLAVCAALTLVAAACGDDDDDAMSGGTTVEDCNAVLAALADIEVTGQAPEVGEEISDEYKDTLGEVVDDLENLDLQADEVRAAVASLVDFANEVIAADTWSEEFETSAPASLTPLTEACAAAVTGSPTST